MKKSLYTDIREILEHAKSNAIRAVNFSMVLAYWQIGKRIVEDEQGGKKRAAYGKAILKELSNKLQSEFGNGFSVQNLEYFRKFYLTFPFPSKSHALHGKFNKEQKVEATSNFPSFLNTNLSWTHYKLLLKVESDKARSYYLIEAIEQNWSTRTLERQINSLYYERLLSSRNKKALQEKVKKDADEDKPTILDFVKDPYVLEFLHLSQNTVLYEQELETELINKLQQFLLELGKGLSFVSRQKRISADEDNFYIDLVFYNYIIKCFVLIDLKVGKLSHQDIGQMDLYVRYYEDKFKQPTDNPTIGIILCTEKNETVVKYSVLKESKQLFASKYKLFLPTEKELIKELESELKAIEIKKMS